MLTLTDKTSFVVYKDAATLPENLTCQVMKSNPDTTVVVDAVVTSFHSFYLVELSGVITLKGNLQLVLISETLGEVYKERAVIK